MLPRRLPLAAVRFAGPAAPPIALHTSMPARARVIKRGTNSRIHPESPLTPAGQGRQQRTRLAYRRQETHTRDVSIPALRWVDPPAGPAIELLDQTRLPAVEEIVTCADVPTLVDAIQRLVVRGAPLLGVAGAYGVALAALRGDDVAQAARALASARPTAVNLGWGVAEAFAAYQQASQGAPGRASAPARPQLVRRRCPDRHGGPGQRGRQPDDHPGLAALARAQAIAAQDAEASAAIAAHGLALVPHGARILTHCNTGALVSAGEGTAFAIILAAHRAGPAGPAVGRRDQAAAAGRAADRLRGPPGRDPALRAGRRRSRGPDGVRPGGPGADRRRPDRRRRQRGQQGRVPTAWPCWPATTRCRSWWRRRCRPWTSRHPTARGSRSSNGRPVKW